MRRKNLRALSVFSFFFTALALAYSTTTARATTVVPMSAAELADRAAVVVVGTVASIESYRTQEAPGMRSTIRFERIEYWKGSPAPIASTIQLTTPGGQVGDTQLRIAGAPELEIGQRWILFVLPEYRTFPVVGIWEGALRVEKDPQGVDRVYSASHQPMLGIDGEGFFVTTTHEPLHASHRLRGTDSARLVDPSESVAGGMNPPSRPLSYEEFMELLRPILAASREYPSATAGRPIPVDYTPAPLGSSPSHEGVTSASDRVPWASEASHERSMPVSP